MMVKVGQKVQFDPFRYITGYGAMGIRGQVTTGTIVYINRKHKWFSVEYGKHKLRTSFKFWDIGRVVTVCG